jgi:hypothetical protein
MSVSFASYCFRFVEAEKKGTRSEAQQVGFLAEADN